MRFLQILVCFLFFVASPLRAQVISGSNSGAGVISPSNTGGEKTGIASQVNEFQGTFGTTIELGKVESPMGLSYSLTMSWSSQARVGDNSSFLSGIPYGDGWSLAIPSVTVQIAQRSAYSTLDYGQMQQSGAEITFTNDELKVEGDYVYYYPYINIPGRVSEYFVFRGFNSKTDNPEFVPKKFDEKVVATLIDGNWIVQFPDGLTYTFFDQIASVYNSNNQRFDQTQVESTGMDEFVNNQRNPCRVISTWYVSRIHNESVSSFERIEFRYIPAGEFNFHEYHTWFEQYDGYMMDGLRTFNSIPSVLGRLVVPTELILQEVASTQYDVLMAQKGIEQIVFQKIELDYEEDVSLGRDGMLLVSNNDGTESVDFMYNRKAVIDQSDFNNWRKYYHLKSNECSTYSFVGTMSSSNPYLTTQGNYARKRNGNYTLDLSDCFVESEWIDFRNLNDDLLIYPGDIVATEFSISGNEYCNFDVNIVTGGGGDNQTIDNALTAYGKSNYDSERYQTLYTTFGNMSKWNPYFKQSTNGTVIRSFFHMGNIPFDGFFYQVGPGNADVDYSYDISAGGNTANVCQSYPWFNTLAYNQSLFPGSYTQYSYQLGYNFGVGLPWNNEREVLKKHLNWFVGGSNTSAQFRKWWVQSGSINCGSNPAITNQPTLTSGGLFTAFRFKVIRYSKKPVVLKRAKFYVINGVLGENDINENLYLINMLEFEYGVEEVDLYDSRVASSPTTQRNVLCTGYKVLLKRVVNKFHEVVNANKLPVTAFEYQKIAPVENAEKIYSNPDRYSFTNSSELFLLTKIVDINGRIEEIQYNTDDNDIVKILNGENVLRYTPKVADWNGYGSQIGFVESSLNRVYTYYFTVDKYKVTKSDDEHYETVFYYNLVTPYLNNLSDYNVVGLEEIPAFSNTFVSPLPDGGLKKSAFAPKRFGYEYVAWKKYHIKNDQGTIVSTLLEGRETKYGVSYNYFGKVIELNTYFNGALAKKTLYSYNNLKYVSNSYDDYQYTRPYFYYSPASNSPNIPVIDDKYEVITAVASARKDHFALWTVPKGIYNAQYAAKSFRPIRPLCLEELSFGGNLTRFDQRLASMSPNSLCSYFVGLAKIDEIVYYPGNIQITNTTEFQYWSANEIGEIPSNSPFYYVLRKEIPVSIGNEVKLKFDPSFNLFSKKNYSSANPGNFQEEQNFYYYDLIQKYNFFDPEFFDELAYPWLNTATNPMNAPVAGVPGFMEDGLQAMCHAVFWNRTSNLMERRVITGKGEAISSHSTYFIYTAKNWDDHYGHADAMPGRRNLNKNYIKVLERVENPPPGGGGINPITPVNSDPCFRSGIPFKGLGPSSNGNGQGSVPCELMNEGIPKVRTVVGDDVPLENHWLPRDIGQQLIVAVGTTVTPAQFVRDVLTDVDMTLQVSIGELLDDWHPYDICDRYIPNFDISNSNHYEAGFLLIRSLNQVDQLVNQFDTGITLSAFLQNTDNTELSEIVLDPVYSSSGTHKPGDGYDVDYYNVDNVRGTYSWFTVDLKLAEIFVQVNTNLESGYSVEFPDIATYNNYLPILQFKKINTFQNDYRVERVFPYVVLSKQKNLAYGDFGIPIKIKEDESIVKENVYIMPVVTFVKDNSNKIWKIEYNNMLSFFLPVKLTASSVGALDEIMEYDYFMNGRIRIEKEYGGDEIEYEYDNVSRLSKIFENGSLVKELSYSNWHTLDLYLGTSSLKSLSDPQSKRTEFNYSQNTSYFDQIAGKGVVSRSYTTPFGDLALGVKQNAIGIGQYDDKRELYYPPDKTVYNQADRVYYPFAETNISGLNLDYPVFGMVAPSERGNVEYENNYFQRPVELTKDGNPVLSGNNFTIDYAIVDYNDLQTELNLTQTQQLVLMPAGSTYFNDYYFNRIQYKDENGNVRIEFKNFANQVIGSLIEVSTGVFAKTIYEYDVHGRNCKIYHPNGSISTYLFNHLGFLYQKSEPNSGITSYMYDKLGNVVLEQNANELNGINSPFTPRTDPYYTYSKYGSSLDLLEQGFVERKVPDTYAPMLGGILFTFQLSTVKPELSPLSFASVDVYDINVGYHLIKSGDPNIESLSWINHYRIVPDFSGDPEFSLSHEQFLDLYARRPVRKFYYDSLSSIGSLVFNNSGTNILNQVNLFNNSIGKRRKLVLTESFNFEGDLILQKFFQYNSNGFPITEIHQVDYDGIDPNNTSRIAVFKIEYEYNKWNELSKERIYAKDGLNTGILKFLREFTYEYNENGALKISNYNSVLGTDEKVSEHAYDAEGRLITTKYFEVDNSTTCHGTEVDNINYVFHPVHKGVVQSLNSNFFDQTLYFDLSTPGNLHVPGVLSQDMPSASINFNGNVNFAVLNYKLDQSAVNPIRSTSNQPLYHHFEGTKIEGYSYDKLNRLTAIDAYINDYKLNNPNTYQQYATAGDVSYSYDERGNVSTINRIFPPENPSLSITEQNDWSFFYTPGTDILLRVEETAQPGVIVSGLNSDVNGNTITDPHKGIIYASFDGLNRLESITVADNGNKTYRYLFDEDLTRIGKKDPNGKKTYELFDQFGAKILSSSFTIDDPLTNNPITRIDQIYIGNIGVEHYTASPDKITFKVFDIQGNLRIMYDLQNCELPCSCADKVFNLVAVYDYFPFGLESRSYIPNALKNEKHLFSNNERDQESKWDYFGARMYDAEYGRFVSQDPLSFLDPSWTPYRYGYNNPISNIDPFGLRESSINGEGWSPIKYNEEGGYFYSVFTVYQGTEIAGYYMVTGSYESVQARVFGYENQVVRINSPELSFAPFVGGSGSDGFSAVDGFQLALDIIGMTEIPIISQVADIASGVIDIAKGDYATGLASMGGAIPFVGTGIKAGVIAARVNKAAGAFNSLRKTGGELYEIGDGVRRAKAAQQMGKKTISAIDNTGKQFDVPIENLRSPMKDAIDLRKPGEKARYDNIVEGTRNGASMPPIYVNPGSRGVTVKDIKIIR